MARGMEGPEEKLQSAAADSSARDTRSRVLPQGGEELAEAYRIAKPQAPNPVDDGGISRSSVSAEPRVPAAIPSNS